MDTITTKQLTFADFVTYLIDNGSGLVHYTTPEQLASFEVPSEFTGLPVYRLVNVYLSEEDVLNNKYVVMVFVDNGAIFYTNGDKLYNTPFEGHFDDIETVFYDYFLDGSQETASFAGFFLLDSVWQKPF